MVRVLIRLKRAVGIIALCQLSACGSELSRIDDDDLRAKIQECDYAVGMSAAEHQICGNYHRECKRRLKSEGRFVCN